MPNRPVTLAAVDEFIAARHKGLSFPVWLENRFEQHTRRRRALRLRAAVPTLVVIYNLFLVSEWLLVPDQIRTSLILHFAVVTPWILLSGWLTTEKSPKPVRETLAGSIPVVIAIQILCVYVFTSSREAAHFQYFVLLLLLFANTVQRLPFRYAAVISCTILVCHANAIWTSGHMSIAAAFVAEITFVVSAYLTLVSNYYMERDSRRAFLRSLRDQLNHAEVEVTANHDALTGLSNRHHLAKRLAEIWQEDGDAVSPVAIIMMDIDHFKPFNDHYGHGVGDDCLRRVASCAIAALRTGDDLAVRYGGEELLVLLPNTDIGAAIRMADEIRSAIENLRIPHEAMGAGQVVTVSCGVAAGPASTVPADELIAAADIALYAAKRSGRNRVWPLPARDATPMREAV